MNKLLIVDQSADFLEIIKNILEGLGHPVRILNHTDNVYSEICEFKPELIILDLFLVCEDGNEDSRVLVFSTSLKYLEDYDRYNSDDFIEKPFDINHLIEKIKSVLHNQFTPVTVS